MIRLRSFQSRVFAVLLGMALVPAALALTAGAFTLGEVGSTVGTLGPWDAVAESGQRLATEAVRAAPGDSAVAAAAADHREALSQSLQRSRLWSLVSTRVRTLLPLAVLLTALLVGALALVAARWLSRSLARPIHELVGWTDRIAREEPLPQSAREGGRVREFAELRKALRSMAEELREARRLEVESARLRAWTEMARRVAHELKNPLTPMRMAATTLARSADPSAEESADVLLEEISRLDEMARSFSQFGRLPEGPRSEVDLVELADELAARHGDVGVPVEVRADGEVPPVMGHHEVLSRAVRNLVVNAVEASSEPSDRRGGRVARGDESPGTPSPVEIAVTRENGAVRLAVRDRGEGIPPDLLDSIWMPDVTTKTEGTGLGLAMVRQAAEAHGGHAFAANREGGGAEIGFVVPVRDASTDPAEPGSP